MLELIWIKLYQGRFSRKRFNLYSIEWKESNEKAFLLKAHTRGKSYMKIMWNYSETSTSHRHKTIILCFLTTTCRSCSLVKLHVWINHVDTWRRFDDDTTSMRLHIYFVSTLKQLGLSKGMQLKYFSRILSNGAEQLYCNVEKVLENIYFVFCILYNAFQRLIVVDTNKQNIDSFAFWFPSVAMYGSIKQRFAQSYQRKLSIDDWQQFCLFLRPERYLHTKLVDF